MPKPFRVLARSGLQPVALCIHCDRRVRIVEYTSANNTWDKLPKEGILVVMTYNADGTREIFQGNDLYFYDPAVDRYGASDGVLANLQLRRPQAVILTGSWTDLPAYESAVQRALDAPPPGAPASE